jgi:hypothetical protein
MEFPNDRLVLFIFVVIWNSRILKELHLYVAIFSSWLLKGAIGIEYVLITSFS